MTPAETSQILKNQAEDILKHLHFFEILFPCKKIVSTGSFYMDLMIYPDIDFYVSKVPITEIFKIAGRFAESPVVCEIRYENKNYSRMKNGIYLKLYLKYGDWKRLWKIDIWFLDDSLIDDFMMEMNSFKNKLTPQLKEKILDYKYSVINDKYRTPMYSGYFIYKAFLDEGIEDFDEVTEYLRKNHIII
jgi:hypothetical protein